MGAAYNEAEEDAEGNGVTAAAASLGVRGNTWGESHVVSVHCSRKNGAGTSCVLLLYRKQSKGSAWRKAGGVYIQDYIALEGFRCFRGSPDAT